MKAGWRVVPLGDVCTVIAGQSPDGSAYNDRKDGLPFYQGKKEFTDRYLGPATTWTTQVTKIAEADDILMSVRAPVGPINLATERICIGRGLAAIRPKTGLDVGFLWYALLWMQPKITGSEGAVFASINRDQICALSIPLPPLDEQKRIVAVLDEVFEGLSRARANAEANLADARELFSAITSDCFLPNSEGWREVALGEVADFRNGLNFTRASKGQRLKIVGVGDFQDNLEVPVDDLAEVLINGTLAKDDHLRSGDILAVRSNGNKALIGRVMMVPEMTDIVSFSGFTIRIRLNSSDILSEYLLQFMRSPKVRQTLTSGGGGSNISNLNQGQLSRLMISFPTKEDQRLILEKINAAAVAIKDLQQQVENQERDLKSLRQSLLQRALSGELTAAIPIASTGNEELDAVLDELFADDATDVGSAHDPDAARRVKRIREILSDEWNGE